LLSYLNTNISHKVRNGFYYVYVSNTSVTKKYIFVKQSSVLFGTNISKLLFSVCMWICYEL